MSRKLKELIVGEFAQRYGTAREALLVNVVGLSGTDANRLRRELRARKLELHVIQNRLLRRVLASRPLAPLAGLLHGPCALITGPNGAVEAAKELVRLAPEFPALELKFGLPEGFEQPLPLAQVAALRSRIELVADVLSCAVSAGRRVAGAASAPGRRVAACIAAIVAKLEKGESIVKAA